MTNKTYKKKLKLIKNKKWMVAIVTTATLLTGGISIHIVREKNNKINSNPDYVVGYDDINLITNFITKKVGNNNFILLDIADHNSISILFQKLKLTYCQKHDIGIGLVINSNSSTLGDVYLDLEYVLGIIEQYKVNYPIYINVDNFLENENLTYDEAITYTEAFLKKAQKNNLYIGVMGKETNITDKFNNYDKLIVDSNNDQEGKIQKKKNYYYADLTLESMIEDNYFNNPTCFREDEFYICQSGDTLRSIANNYGLSVMDLKKFNKIDNEQLNEGTIVRIPSEVQNINRLNTSSKEIVYSGIDVSSWQGEIDWNQVETDFAIIRVKDFYHEENDPQFINNVLGCQEKRIPMGFYAFSRATTLEEIREEAKYVINELKNIEVTYPVYLDLETDFWQFQHINNKITISTYNEEETKNFVISILKIWETEMSHAGYVPGIYCNQTLYNDLLLASDGYINQLATWIAGGSYYDKEVNYNDKNTLPQIDFDVSCGMRQISSFGILDGIYNVTSEYVDIDYCYVDYESKGYHWDLMKFPDFSNFPEQIVRGFVPLGTGLLLGMFLKRKKRKKRTRMKQTNNRA